MGWKGIVVVGVVLVVLAFAIIVNWGNNYVELREEGQTKEANQEASQPEPQQTTAGSIVFISGVENGECVVPSVNLWSRPGGAASGAIVSTSVSGCTGFPVMVVETKYISPRLWYHVKTYGANAGKEGWVTDSFIKE